MSALETTLRERLDEASAAAGAVGAVACVCIDGERASAATGRTERDGEPVTVETPFRLGSIAKVVTAAVLTESLLDEGRSLDDPVADLLPGSVPPSPPPPPPTSTPPTSTATAAATWRHLLTHRSGIDGTFWDGFGDGPDAIRRYAAATATLPTVFEPGASWGYANSGFVLAGAAIEAITGRPFDEAVAGRLLAPLGIAGSTTMWSDRPPPGAANGHYLGADGSTPAELPHGLRALAPAGATAWSTASDVITLADGLLADGWERLAADGMATPMPPGGGSAATHQSLGWRMFRWGDVVLFGHDGGATGMGSFVRWAPRRRTGIAVMVNSVPSALLLWTQLSTWFFEAAAITVPPVLTAADDATVEPMWCGEYRARDATFVVEHDDSQPTLALRVDGLGGSLQRTVALEPLGPGVYRADGFVTDPTRIVSFERLADGTRLLHSGPFTARTRAAAAAGSTP